MSYKEVGNGIAYCHRTLLITVKLIYIERSGQWNVYNYNILLAIFITSLLQYALSIVNNRR